MNIGRITISRDVCFDGQVVVYGVDRSWETEICCWDVASVVCVSARVMVASGRYDIVHSSAAFTHGSLGVRAFFVMCHVTKAVTTMARRMQNVGTAKLFTSHFFLVSFGGGCPIWKGT